MINTYEKAISFFPVFLRATLHSLYGSLGKEERVSEIRLRQNAPISLTVISKDGEKNRVYDMTPPITEQTLRTILSQICQGSFHTYESEILRGWFSPQSSEGIRIGVAGNVLCEGERVAALKSVQALCLRLPQLLPRKDARAMSILQGESLLATESYVQDKKKELSSTLFYAPPGVGKTTLLRNLIKSICSGNAARRAAVIDSSAELHTSGFEDCIADFFIGYPKEVGIGLAVRAFSPEVLFCDELGSQKEAESLLRTQVGGVPIVATAHASSLDELLARPTFALLHQNRVFDRYIRLFRVGDAFSFLEERVGDSI